ncbi:MAG: hypothetical protein K2Q18_05885, partial [Bdellovibrionales bacterium]|nr:hypothetical protein [Bdellovibrionales bacterium]
MEEVILTLPTRILFLSLMVFISFGVKCEDIVPGKGAVVSSIEWKSSSLKERFGGYFIDIVKKPFDPLTLKIQADLISKELFSAGYFSSSVKTELGGNPEEVIVKLSIELKEKTNFEFLGNKIFSHQELRTKLLDKIRNEFGKVDVQDLSNYISEVYEERGFYQTGITYYQDQGFDKDKVKMVNFHFTIDEGIKIDVRDISYRGNSFLSKEEIQKIFNTHATSLAKGGFYDKVFFEEFSDILKKEYLSRGFVFIEVSKPRVVTSDDEDYVSIEYGITERQQVNVK